MDRLGFILALLSVLTAPPAARPATVQGQVLNETGMPLAGAAVRLIPAGAGTGETATTADNGLFRLAVDGEGLYELRVEARGFAPAVRPLPPLVEDRGVPPVSLRPGRRLEVRVTSPEGGPVAGARVTAVASAVDGETGWRPGKVIGRTNEAGTAELFVAEGRELWLEVVTAEHPPLRRRIPAGAGVAAVELARGRVVTLEVIGPEGEPRPGVRVVLADDLPLGETDDAGRLSTTLPAGEAALRAVAPDGAWAEVVVPSAGDEEPGPITVRLASPHRLEGRVVDADRHTPIAAAWVWHEGSKRAVRTDGRGAFSLAIPFRRPAQLAATAAGHLPSVAASGARQVVIGLEPAARLHGRLLDPNGHPVSAGTITLAPADVAAPPAERSAWAWSDEEGCFLLNGLPPEPAWLRVRGAGFVPEIHTVRLARAAETGPVELTLEPALRAVGRVVGPEGEPVAGAEVHLLPSTSRRSAEALLTASERVIHVRTGAAGEFTAPGVPPGELDLSIHGPGWAPRTIQEAEGTMVAAGIVDLGTFALEPAVSLEGWVTSPEGEPLSGVAVTATAAEPAAVAGEPAGPVTTDAQGWFAVPDLAAGRAVTLRFEREGWQPVVRNGAVPPAPALHVEMERATALSGRVFDESGRPVAGAEVMARRLTDAEEWLVGLVRSDDRGAFDLAGLPAGRLRVIARATGWASGMTDPLELAPGEVRRDLEIELPRGAALAGTVRTVEGKPVAGARLIATPEDRRGLVLPLETTSGDEGTYRLDGLDLGSWSLTVSHPDHPRLRHSVRVDAGEQRLDLTLEPGSEIAGRVVTEAAVPASGARVRLVPQNAVAVPPPSVTAPDGTFRFTGLAAGTYRLSAELDGAAAARDVDLSTAPLADLELRLAPGGSVAGRVLGLSAAELAAGHVTAAGPDGAVRHASLSADGGYRLEGLSAGAWILTARGGEDGRQASRRLELATGEDVDGVDLEIETGYRLTGRVLAAGEPASGAVVSVTGAAGAAGGARTGPDGGFVVPSLLPGTYRLLVLNPATGDSRIVEIRLEGDRDLEIELE